MIPSSSLFDQPVIATFVNHDPLVQAHREFFALFDWSVVTQWQERCSPRGRPAHPESAYLKAFFIRINEGMSYTWQLRKYLMQYPSQKGVVRLR